MGEEVTIYRAPAIEEVQAFYGELVFQTEWYYCIREHLLKLAQRLLWGLKSGVPAVRHEASNFHPAYLGKLHEAFQKADWSLEDAQVIIAAQYGFTSWEDVEALGMEEYDDIFESALGYILNGDIARLAKVLGNYPELLSMRSKYGHGATLLHYVSSNGVEIWRQQVPSNLPEITALLIDQGADRNATMHAYGEELTALDLLGSSAHPFEAGIGERLEKVLSQP